MVKINPNHNPKSVNLEKVTFPLTGPANKDGIQMLFEDDEMHISKIEDSLIRRWKNGRPLEYAVLDENESNPEFVEWKEMIDMRDYKVTEKGDYLINPKTGHQVSLKQLKKEATNDNRFVRIGG